MRPPRKSLLFSLPEHHGGCCWRLMTSVENNLKARNKTRANYVLNENACSFLLFSTLDLVPN
jgi:hypothetical protein